MSRKNVFKILFCIFIGILNVCIFAFIKVGDDDIKNANLVMRVKSDKASVYQVYCTDNEVFSEEDASSAYYGTAGKTDKLIFNVDLSKPVMRFNLGYEEAKIEIYDIWLMSSYRQEKIELKKIADTDVQLDISSKVYEDGVVKIESSGSSPQFVVDIDTNAFKTRVEAGFARDTKLLDIVLCVFVDLIAFFVLIRFDRVVELPADIVRERKLILTLAKNDFRTKFAGSYLGIVWAFVQPVVTVLTYWFVFQVGLKAGRVSEYPFAIWLTVGIVPWFFFSDAVTGGTNVLIEYSYLVKKVVFKIDILPVVKMISAMFVHLFFVGFAMLLCGLYGYTPDIYDLQVIYYIICNCAFAIGIIYLTSAVVLFFRDLSQIINIILQVGIWFSPIMWDAENMLSPRLLILFRMNPMYYIVDGFRDALLEKNWVFDKGLWTVYFWIFVVAIYLVGTTMFRKLKVHFADVL